MFLNGARLKNGNSLIPGSKIYTVGEGVYENFLIKNHLLVPKRESFLSYTGLVKDLTKIKILI